MSKQVLEILNDPKMMKASHPVRCRAMGSLLVDGFRTSLGDQEWRLLQAALYADDLVLCGIPELLISGGQCPNFSRVMRETLSFSGGTEAGNSYAVLASLRQIVAPYPHFTIDDSLVELLEHTDLGEDIPVSYMRLPYARMYVEFGQTRRPSGLSLPNLESGDHVVEGAYCEWGKHPDWSEGLFIVFTGSPMGKTNLYDDATQSLFLPIEQDDTPLCDVFEGSFQRANELARVAGLVPSPNAYRGRSLECLHFLAKALLYISLPEARKTTHAEYSEWEKAGAALKSPAKRAKHERKARTLRDHVVISAPAERHPSGVPYDDSHAGRTVRAHWRRGHYRMQAFGEKLSQRKLMFIRPTLVGSASGSTRPGRYVVK